MQTITCQSIESQEAINSPNSLQVNFSIFPGAISTAEAFGAARLNFSLLLTGLVSAEAFGAIEIQRHGRVSAVGAISSAEAFGTLQTGYVMPASMSDEAFGTPRIGTILPDGQDFSGIGTPEIRRGAVVLMSGISSEESFGRASLGIRLIGIAPGEVGTPVVRFDNVLVSSKLLRATRGPVTVETP